MAKYPNEPEGQRPSQQTPSQSQGQGQSQGPPPPLQSGQRLNVQFVTVNDPVDTVARLNDRGALTVAFPPCAEEIVSLIRTSDQDEITKFFNEYFVFCRHLIFGDLPVVSRAERAEDAADYERHYRQPAEPNPAGGVEGLACVIYQDSQTECVFHVAFEFGEDVRILHAIPGTKVVSLIAEGRRRRL